MRPSAESCPSAAPLQYAYPSAHCDEHAAPQSLVRLAIVIAIARHVCLVFGAGLVALVSIVALATLALLLAFLTTASITRYPAGSTQADFEVARDSRDPAARWHETQRSAVTANGHAGIERNEPQRNNQPTIATHPKHLRMCPGHRGSQWGLRHIRHVPDKA